jgi:peptidoglycan/LPS O-acetylase OafA/YrhL
MIDSMLTLTKRGAFWLALLFVVAVLMDIGISALVGQQEPMFLLFAAAILALFIVACIYTLAKKLIGFFRHRTDKTP